MRRKKKIATRYEVPKGGRVLPYTSPTGIHTVLYSISTVAYALGRTPESIRKWEIAGSIPLTPFKVGGIRMYSDQHIDALVETAEKHRLRPKCSILRTGFSAEVYKRYEEIYNMFFNTDKKEDE